MLVLKSASSDTNRLLVYKTRPKGFITSALTPIKDSDTVSP
jgi:hypothetical protein